MERPKIEFKEMSHPNFPAWEVFAKECYEHMDELDTKIKTRDGLHSEMVKICNHHLMQIEKIKKYADHKDDCNKFGEFFRPEDQECTCGLDDIIIVRYDR